MAKILIAGGTGLIGGRLSYFLREAGHEVRILSRRRGVKWDPSRGFLAEDAFDGIDILVNLAGAGIADKRWTDARKRELIDSRLQTTQLLAREMASRTHSISTVIQAGAIGYYGDRGAEELTESSSVGTGFLAELSASWEDAAADFSAHARLCILRIGIVLSRHGGALPEMSRTMGFGIAGVLGSGRQYTPWIHIDDLCRMFLTCMFSSDYSGVYNAVGPAPMTASDFMAAMKRARGGFALTLPVPAFGLRLALGEMAAMVLLSSRVLPDRFTSAGFSFEFSDAESAMRAAFDQNS